MTQEQIMAAIIAFLSGLFTKFLYDIWQERRHQKSLLFVKSVSSSFSVDMLEEDLREQINIRYQGRSITSVYLFRVEVENNGRAVVRNQAFTVRFAQDACILGEPQSKSSPEDLRYIHRDPSFGSENEKRFLIDLLQKNHKVGWDFIVVNQSTSKFEIHPGVAKNDAEDVDYDVETSVTEERAQLNLADRLKRLALFILGIPIVVLFRRMIAALAPQISPVSTLLAYLIHIYLLIYIAWQVRELILPMMNWLKDIKPIPENPIITIDSSDGAVVVLGDQDEVSVQLDYSLLREKLQEIITEKWFELSQGATSEPQLEDSAETGVENPDA